MLSPYAVGSGAAVSIHVDSIVITGDRADVRFTMIYVNGGSYESSGSFVLMKHGNDWLIHNVLDY